MYTICREQEGALAITKLRCGVCWGRFASHEQREDEAIRETRQGLRVPCPLCRTAVFTYSK
jgi:hypothetical protein